MHHRFNECGVTCMRNVQLILNDSRTSIMPFTHEVHTLGFSVLECSHTKTLWNRVFTLHLAIQIPLNGWSLFSKRYNLNEFIYVHWPNLTSSCTIQSDQGSMGVLEACQVQPNLASTFKWFICLLLKDWKRPFG